MILSTVGLMFGTGGSAIVARMLVGYDDALNDGLTSALISFLRTLLFQSAAVLLLPKLLSIDGVWISIVAAEFMVVILSAFFLVIKRNKYHHF